MRPDRSLFLLIASLVVLCVLAFSYVEYRIGNPSDTSLNLSHVQSWQEIKQLIKRSDEKTLEIKRLRAALTRASVILPSASSNLTDPETVIERLRKSEARVSALKGILEVTTAKIALVEAGCAEEKVKKSRGKQESILKKNQLEKTILQVENRP